jgi:hypothetical protein
MSDLDLDELVARMLRTPPPDHPDDRPSGDALPPLTRLDRFLAEPDPDVRYRIDRLWPAHGRVLLAAQYKAGKTTIAGNLLRSLADGDPFLDRYHVDPPAGPVVLIDDELHPATLRSWLRGQGIVHTDRVHVVALRGRVGTFDIMSDRTRDAWARQLADLGTAVVLLDCLRPIIDALGLSEDKDSGKVLGAFDELLGAAGADEAAVLHHMGHQGERSRGDSRLRDWPDAEWRLVRDGDQPADPRYFAAYGRDVDEAEQRVELDGLRRLIVTGGTRRDAAARDTVAAVVAAVTDRPGMTVRELRGSVEGRAGDVDQARAAAIEQGLIRTEQDGRAIRHHPNVSHVSDRVPDTGHVGAVNVSRVLIGTRTRHGTDGAPHRVPDTDTDTTGGADGQTPAHGWGSCVACGRRIFGTGPCRECQAAS